MTGRLAILGVLALAVALPGCAAARMEVRVRNQTQAPVAVDVWINQTQEPSWHRSAVVPPGGEVALGVFGGPAHNDYSMVAMAGGLRAGRAAQPLGDSYPGWTLTVFADRIEDSLVVY